MGDDSEDSLDDYFSYTNTAKRTFEIVRRKKAEFKPTALIVDFSSDSDDISECRVEALPVTTKTSKRKGETHTATRRSKRGRNVGSKVLNARSSSQNEKYIDLNCTGDSVEDNEVFYTAITPDGLTSKPGVSWEVESCNIIDSDEKDSDVSSEVVEVLSHSSEVEILSSPENTVVSKNEKENDENELISIKISWKLQPIQKFQLRRHQKFKSLMEHFSKLEGVPLHKIVIYGGRNNCRLIQPFDTPDTVGVTITDVFEGGVLVEGSELRSQRLRGLAGQHGDGITVRVQLEGIRSFPVMIGCNQKMQVLLVKVAEQLEVDVDKVRLSLDGEMISSSSTAKELDLEEGDVLDVRLL